MQILAHASCSPGKDITKSLKMLEDLVLPKDPEAVYEDILKKQASMAKEKDTTFTAEYKDGIIRIKRVPGNA